MADKSSFTPEEWKLLLESVMMAGIAVTAAEPSGLWGVLKESFASGSALRQAKMDPGSNPLIKAVAADFETAEDKAPRAMVCVKSSSAADQQRSRRNVSRRCGKPERWSPLRRRTMQPPSGGGSAISASTSPRQPRKVGFSVSAAC